MIARLAIGALLLLCAGVDLAPAADLVSDSAVDQRLDAPETQSKLRGRVSVVSGDTLWFPILGRRVQLAGIQACPVPQWGFDPKPQGTIAITAPIPCGPLAKAWLKRVVGNRPVVCRLVPPYGSEVPAAKCSTRGRDLGLEMLRVGWARVAAIAGPNPRYLTAERYARSARYGLWGTYVLDMDEWNRKAVDRTVERQPLADRALLQEREREITPLFADWRNRPRRRDH
ncbi:MULTISPECIES: thermonuclease family protein [Rhizobium]|uniref:Endonuclease YncB(Thermonuclease family) n=1 Tax=Rhizobium paranaense TaxID=1650438 RepID=A0A7W9D461_9HYPH|nr:thermonuclease family protein [Rhizobium paranaense]MBB5577112.1 endonuclease YncB(thermonuclease family) [Rhizobium paranaense]